MARSGQDCVMQYFRVPCEVFNDVLSTQQFFISIDDKSCAAGRRGSSRPPVSAAADGNEWHVAQTRVDSV